MHYYLADGDDGDEEIVWTVSGNTELTVEIADRVVTVGIPDADWNGSETLTFTATDPEGLSVGDEAAFTVDAVHDSPIGLIEELIAYIHSLNLPKGTEQSLVAKLYNAIKSLEKGHYTTAINQISAFRNNDPQKS